MAFASATTPKNPMRQARTVRPVSGRGWVAMSSSCGCAEVVAGGCALSGDHVIKVKADRGGRGRMGNIVGNQHPHLAGLVRADLDDEPPVVPRLHHIDERAGQTR